MTIDAPTTVRVTTLTTLRLPARAAIACNSSGPGGIIWNWTAFDSTSGAPMPLDASEGSKSTLQLSGDTLRPVNTTYRFTAAGCAPADADGSVRCGTANVFVFLQDLPLVARIFGGDRVAGTSAVVVT